MVRFHREVVAQMVIPTPKIENRKQQPHNPIFAALDNGMSDDENSEVIATVNDKPLNTISNSEFPDSSDQD